MRGAVHHDKPADDEKYIDPACATEKQLFRHPKARKRSRQVMQNHHQRGNGPQGLDIQQHLNFPTLCRDDGNKTNGPSARVDNGGPRPMKMSTIPTL
ncbi:hypothetical protein [Sphingomonas sp.]|uniref:hypothetical protein n=1 Tax=Sphingomonas sp. TaxID=28214 RepID=UPI0035A8324C